MTGLVDCNNFFVSCERTVNPSLEGRAVVVLSNNDGCAVARSNEAKALGIKMGQPAFEIRDLINSGKVVAISGHHLLYRDISIRVHSIFRRYVPDAIDYSVDESFLDMDGIPVEALHEIGTEICRACREEVNIPVTIGFAPTKTLAKIVTECCKKKGVSIGIIEKAEDANGLISSMPISDLWGIGRRLSKRLYQSGIFTIADFYSMDRHDVKNKLGVNGEKSWYELHGIPAIDLSHVERLLQDSISETRTFPHDVNDYDYLRARISIYAVHCAEKLRAMEGVCSRVTTFLRTNRFHPEKGVYCPEYTLALINPTSVTSEIVKCAVTALQHIYSPVVAYKRGGVLLTGISHHSAVSRSLFDDVSMAADAGHGSSGLLDVVDEINRIPGMPPIRLASQFVKGTPGHNDGYSSSFQAPSAKKTGRWPE